MPSSTSSSDQSCCPPQHAGVGREPTAPDGSTAERRQADEGALPPHPWLCWATALSVGLSLVLLAELAWRRAGIKPSIVDDRMLWSAQRERVDAQLSQQVVFIGSSRLQLGLVPDLFREATGGWEPVQLAVDGAAPMATLRDIAAHSEFRGGVVFSLLPWCLLPELWRMQEEHVRFYNTQWNALTRLSRDLRSSLEQRVVAVNPHVNLLRVLPRLVRGEGVPTQFLFTHRDRWREAQYAVVPNIEQVAADRTTRSHAEFAALQDSLSEANWVDLVARIDAFVDRIQDRGGWVVFLRCPSTGAVWDLEQEHFPRAHYWEVIVENTTAVTIHFQDVPAMRELPCPDGSHLDAEHARLFTQALVEELTTRGLLTKKN